MTVYQCDRKNPSDDVGPCAVCDAAEDEECNDNMKPRMKFCIGRCGRAYYSDYSHDVCMACGGRVVDEEIEGL